VVAQPHIHFIQSETLAQCEDLVNAWVDRLPFIASVLNINVMPMMLNGKCVFVAVVTYTEAATYVTSKGDIA
jgi:hypothetical protein